MRIADICKHFNCPRVIFLYFWEAHAAWLLYNCIHNPYKGRVNLFLLHDVTCHFLKLSIFTVYRTVIIRQCRLTIKHEYGTACLISLVLSRNVTVPEELFCFLLWKLHIKTKESPKNVHPRRCCLSLSEGQMIYSSIVQTTLQ